MNKWTAGLALVAMTLTLAACGSNQGLEDRLKALETKAQGLEDRTTALEARAQGLEDRANSLEQRPAGPTQ